MLPILPWQKIPCLASEAMTRLNPEFLGFLYNVLQVYPMYLGCLFCLFVYVEFFRIFLQSNGLYLFPCTINCQTRVKTTILADKGYDSRKFRKFAFTHGIYPRIPKRLYTTEGKDPYRSHMYRYDPEEGKYRFIVERTNAWFKSFRRLRNRFDYHAASFESWLYLAIIIVCVRRLVL